MNQLCGLVLAALLSLLIIGPLAHADGPKKTAKENPTVKIDLLLGPGESKAVSVSLGQTAREVFNLSRPAKLYVDDDPWLAYPAAGGGHYLLMFRAEGTVKEMRGQLDSSRDKLYAVVRYPKKSTDNGRFLLPKAWESRVCGEFVTLRVPVGSDKARVATVTLGMRTSDVMQLFQPALDQWEDASGILYNSVAEGGRYLLIFSPPDKNDEQDRKLDKLVEIFYRPGEKAEAMYLLPHKKRGQAVPPKYREVLGEGGE